MATVEERLAALEKKMHGILHGHGHNTRDVLHARTSRMEEMFSIMLPILEGQFPELKWALKRLQDTK